MIVGLLLFLIFALVFTTIQTLLLRKEGTDSKTYAKEHSDGLECEGLSLGELSQYLNISNPRAHRALADAETTAKVYLALLDRFGTEKTHTGFDEQLEEEWV